MPCPVSRADPTWLSHIPPLLHGACLTEGTHPSEGGFCSSAREHTPQSGQLGAGASLHPGGLGPRSPREGLRARTKTSRGVAVAPCSAAQHVLCAAWPVPLGCTCVDMGCSSLHGQHVLSDPILVDRRLGTPWAWCLPRPRLREHVAVGPSLTPQAPLQGLTQPLACPSTHSPRQARFTGLCSCHCHGTVTWGPPWPLCPFLLSPSLLFFTCHS